MQDRYVYLLKQHIGVPSQPVVQIGERVMKGSLIAAIPENSLGAAIHASVSGVVTSVDTDKIEILADEKQSQEYLPIKGVSIIELIKAAGIVGMGGAGFPAHVKLGTPLAAGGMVIVNAAECEPILEHNIKRIEYTPEKIYHGLLYAMEAVRADYGILAIKEKHRQAIEALKPYWEKNNSLKIKFLPDLYPMGEERAILREVLGVLLGPGELPSAANAVICNTETICRIAEAVELKKPSITKDITIAGQVQGENIEVLFDLPTGMLVGNVLEKDGGLGQQYGELLMGGPFTGKSTSSDSPITKISGGVIATMPFVQEKRPMGLLVCACGGDEGRLKEIAGRMGASVVDVAFCKQAERQKKGMLKCKNPGCCPGQAERVLQLKKAGARALLISNCTDCTNTVMAIAPKLNLPVYHATDHVLRAVHMPLIRKMKLRIS